MEREDNFIFMHQSRFIAELLKATGMAQSHPVSTPATPYMKLSKEMCSQSPEDHAELEKERAKRYYRSTVSSRLWLLHTGPDNSFAHGDVCRFVSNPVLCIIWL